MTLTQSIELGKSGTEIVELLNDIKDAALTNETRDMEFKDSCPKQNLDDKQEYIEHTIEMILAELTKLKQK